MRPVKTNNQKQWLLMLFLQALYRRLKYRLIVGHHRGIAATHHLQAVFPVTGPRVGAEIRPLFSTGSPVLGGDIPHQPLIKPVILVVPFKMHPPRQHRVIPTDSHGVGNRRHIDRQSGVIVEYL